ncbi:MAG: hypothetical protein ACI4ST_01345 [Candidatus Gallimonas sp.]
MELKRLPYASGKNKREVRRLYRAAFPKAERAPWRLLRRDPRAEISVYYDGATFVGFTVSLPTETFYYVFYLAIAQGARSKGYGGAILNGICSERSPVVLDMEAVDPAAPNYAQRLKRKEFYLRHGFAPVGFTYSIFGVQYEVLCRGEGFDVSDYERFYKERFKKYCN